MYNHYQQKIILSLGEPTLDMSMQYMYETVIQTRINTNIMQNGFSLKCTSGFILV